MSIPLHLAFKKLSLFVSLVSVDACNYSLFMFIVPKSPPYSSKSFRFCPVVFKSLIHVEVIFVYNVR